MIRSPKVLPLLLLLACVGEPETIAPPDVVATAAAVSAATGPNFLIIMTDDQDYPSIWQMPNLVNRVINQGATYTRHIANQSLCCPNRTTYLTGKYPHSHNVVDNVAPFAHAGFYNSRQDTSTIAVWFQRAGYRTSLSGKYLNDYPNPRTAAYIPPGWTDWHTFVGKQGYLGYDATNNGVKRFYPNVDSLYSSDVFGRFTLQFMRNAMTANTAFLAFYHPVAPHQPATPARRYAALGKDSLVPKPNYNELDVSDKPGFIKNLPRLSGSYKNTLDLQYSKRIATMKVVDEWIGIFLDTLQARGKLNNTYIIFTTDNGWHMGEHRLPFAKRSAYFEDVHLPLIIRGPGVPAGRTINALVGSHDFAPTLAALANIPVPAFVEGRSAAGWLTGSIPWRTAVSVENEPFGPADNPVQPYWAVYEWPWAFVQYIHTGEVELYNLNTDPFQLNSVHAQNPAIVQQLKARSQAIRACSGASCKSAEN